jgi:hypothetical protein
MDVFALKAKQLLPELAYVFDTKASSVKGAVKPFISSAQLYQSAEV